MTGEDHWGRATAGLPTPLVAVDLDAFDANADDLVRRAGGLPVRVASKSVRCRALLARVLGRPGFAGVMAYAVPEAVWLAREGVRDIFVAYPSVDVPALREVATDDLLRAEVTVTIDSVEHVRWLRDVLGAGVVGLGVAVDVDASLRLSRLHLGVRRSPTRSPAEALAVVRAAAGVGLDVRGVMFYDAQVAGLPDAGPHVRAVKRRSVRHLEHRRAAVVDAVREEVDLRFVNARWHRAACTSSARTASSPSSPPGRDSTVRRCSTATTTSGRSPPWPSPYRSSGDRHGSRHGIRRGLRRKRCARLVTGAQAGAPGAVPRACRGDGRGADPAARRRRRRPAAR